MMFDQTLQFHPADEQVEILMNANARYQSWLTKTVQLTASSPCIEARSDSNGAVCNVARENTIEFMWEWRTWKAI